MEQKIAEQNREIEKLTSINRVLQRQKDLVTQENIRLLERLSQCHCKGEYGSLKSDVHIVRQNKRRLSNDDDLKTEKIIIENIEHLSDGDAIMVEDDCGDSLGAERSQVLDDVRVPVSIECAESAELTARQRTITHSVEAALLWILVLASACIPFSQRQTPQYTNEPISRSNSSKLQYSMKSSLQLLPATVKQEMLLLLKQLNQSSLRSLLAIAYSSKLQIEKGPQLYRMLLLLHQILTSPT